MTGNQWVSDNYDNILQWAKNACQQHNDWDDLAHYAITVFLEHDKADELVDKGHARWFIVRIMLNSSRGKKSEYYRHYRPAHNELTGATTLPESAPYDKSVDTVTEWINGILEDLKHGDPAEWYMSTVLEMCLAQKKLNFSKLARETGIPRTSIANAYYNGIEYIKERLLEYGDNYDDIRASLHELLDNKH